MRHHIAVSDKLVRKGDLGVSYFSKCFAPIHAGYVHIWRTRLALPLEKVQALSEVLSPSEVKRAEKFHFAKDRRRFIVAHGVLRHILALYTGIEPTALQFQFNDYGKPDLVPDCGGAWLKFNLAHSHELALYGVTCENAIGVDVELIHADWANLQIARQFFAPAEIEMLKSVTGEDQVKAFFNCWTRKEAYIKARGEGLSLSLDKFEVSVIPGEPVRLLKAVDPDETSQWSLFEVDSIPGYVVALAVKGAVKSLSCWDWVSYTAQNS